MAACSSGGDDANSPVTLRYAIWDPSMQPAVQKIVNKFEESHKNVTIKIETTGFGPYWTKLETAVKSGTAPDLFWMNAPNFGLYQQSGKLAELDSAGADSLSHQAKQAVGMFTASDGAHYGMPFFYDAIGLWYNKKIFDDAGVSYPDSSWTWDDYLAAAKELTDPAKGIYGGAAPVANQEGYYNTIFQAGGEIINKSKTKSGFDSAEAQAGIQFWVDLLKSGASPSLQQLSETNASDQFISGKVAMVWWESSSLNGFLQADALKGNLAVAPLPKGKERATVTHSLSVVVSKDSKHLKAAQEFQDFTGTKEAAQLFAEGGNLSSYDGMETVWEKQAPDVDLSVFPDSLAYAQPYPATNNTSAWQSLESKYLTPAYDGSTTVADATKQLAAAINKVLAAEKH